MKYLTAVSLVTMGLLLIAASLVGCATTPPHSNQLDEARAQVQTLAQDPLAQQAAADDLRAAQRRLQEADAMLQQKKPMSDVDHLAYLAERHAQAGEARVQAARENAEVARARDERTRILLAARAREAESTKAQLAQTQQQLADLQAKQTERGAVLTLGDVLFDTGGSSLKPGADLSLDRLASYLKAHPQTKILIEGHTDSRGSDEYNDALSQRRADAVEKALIVRDVSPDAIRAVGRGKSFPVATNDTPAGRQQNRRVEIVFSDNSGRFAQSDTEASRR
jgi:OmpA-OmpF porin, OOP family